MPEKGVKDMGESEMIQKIYEELIAFKDEMHAFKDEMHAFKDEMLAFKDETKREFEDVKSEISVLKGKVAYVQLMLENETNRNIQIIAEGHLDLARKLNEAIRKGNSNELCNVRLNVLEGEVSRLKKQMQLT